MASEKPSAQAWTDAQACWESFAQYPTYIHPDTAVRAIATVLDAAREQGRNEREAEIVAWLSRPCGRADHDDRWCPVCNDRADLANDIKRGAGRKEDK